LTSIGTVFLIVDKFLGVSCEKWGKIEFLLKNLVLQIFRIFQVFCGVYSKHGIGKIFVFDRFQNFLSSFLNKSKHYVN
jgi:hypothetical protein